MADGTRIQVLLIEDNPGDARLVREALLTAPGGGFALDHVERLSAGLARIDKGGLDVVLLDLSLPDAQGLATLEKVRAKAPGVPIVILTGLDDEKRALEAVKKGAQDYLVKGRGDGDTLARAVRYAIERKEAVRELEGLRQQMAMSEMLASLGALVSGLTQEVRTYSASVSNTIFQIRQKVIDAAAKEPKLAPLAQEVTEASVAALEAAGRIDRLVRDLRRFSGGERAPRARKSLHEPVGAAVDVFQASRRGRVHVVTELAPTPPIDLDPLQIQQVVLSLLENAADATPAGGAVRISTRAVQGGAEIAVRDEGPGIPADVQKRLYEPFFTTKKEATGLGLAIAKRIVDSHRGTIRFTTGGGGQGTTFTVLLPAA